MINIVMKYPKKTIALLLISLNLNSMISNSANANGVPVIDVAHIHETVLQYLQSKEDYLIYVDQLITLKERLDVAKLTYEEVRGITTIGEAVQFILDQLAEEGLPALPPTADYVAPEFEADEVFKTEGKAKLNYKIREEFVFGNIAEVNLMYKTVAKRRATIQELRAKIKEAIWPKQIADLHARIGLENALISNDLAQIQLFQISLLMAEKAIEHNEGGRRIYETRTAADVQ